MAELTDLEWDVERKPEKPEQDEPAAAPETAAEAAGTGASEALVSALASVQAQAAVPPAAAAGMAHRRVKAARRRGTSVLPIVTYIVVFVAVALTTAALIITLT